MRGDGTVGNVGPSNDSSGTHGSTPPIDMMSVPSAGFNEYLLTTTTQALRNGVVGGTNNGVVSAASKMAPFMDLVSSLPTAATALSTGAPPPNVSIDAAWMASSGAFDATAAPSLSPEVKATPMAEEIALKGEEEAEGFGAELTGSYKPPFLRFTYIYGSNRRLAASFYMSYLTQYNFP